MDFDIAHMWSQMNALVKMVVIVLTIQGIGTVYVTIDRLIMLFLSNKKSRVFAAEAGAKLARGDYDEVVAIATEHEGSHLARFIKIGLKTFQTGQKAGHSDEKAAVLAHRALERAGENLSQSLNKGLNILASTGSTAPFVGLLGTVFGILAAFKAIGGDQGGGGLSTIGPLIAEALVVTGYGLIVAIPTVLLFNFISGKIATYEAGLANAGSELIDALETGVPQAAIDEAAEGNPEALAQATA